MSNEVQKWADSAMFKAEPLKASDGPKVYLIWMTPDPLGAIAAMAKMYKGEVVRSLADVTHAERKHYMEEMQKTKLKAPLEAVKLHFMVEGVTRSFTHQMVRQRTAVYAQESLRFAVKEDMAEGVALPPSIAETEPSNPGVTSYDYDRLSAPDKMRSIWDNTVDQIGYAYNQLIGLGMPAEDARGLLPHNITTRLNYVTDLRALQDHAGNRLCTQAQFEWRLVLSQLVEAIRNHQPHQPFRDGINAQWGRIPGFAVEESNERDSWQFKAVADLFRPVCYLTGKCEFKAEFDRACSIRDRVEANHAEGRGSENWSQDYDNGRVFIPEIKPAEWLLDPKAAR